MKAFRFPTAFLVAIVVCLAVNAVYVLPLLWERINIDFAEGQSPGYWNSDLQIPGRPCRYTVKKWGPLAGKPHGRLLSWHPNGRVASQAFNVNGKNHGIAILWDEQGDLVYQERWVHGVCQETRLAPPWFSEEEMAEANPRMWTPTPQMPESAKTEQTSEAKLAAARARIRHGLIFLARQQNSDGSWSEKVGRIVYMEYRGKLGKHVGVTALACLAFLRNGSLPSGEGPYADNVKRGIDFIVRNTQTDGFITANETRMYSHGFAVLCLAEACRLAPEDKVLNALKKSVSVILKAQNEQGGWRYQPVAEDADLTVTVCQLMALRAAQKVGISVPKSAIEKTINYIQLSFVPRAAGTGAFLYQHENLPGGRRQRSRWTFALTACGVTALLGAGDSDVELVTKGIRYLERNKFPRYRAKSSFDYYYGMYYATQAMFQRGGRDWTRWRSGVWRDLATLQESDGSWVDLVGPNYATAMACLILQMSTRP